MSNSNLSTEEKMKKGNKGNIPVEFGNVHQFSSQLGLSNLTLVSVQETKELEERIV